MDFLDPKKERRNRIGLLVGYVLVTIAIVIASIVLLYQTDGYCLDNSGAVNRCGLVFLSSDPSGSTIYVDGKVRKARTNTKLNLRSGTYAIRIARTGYREWARTVTVAGGDVQRFDYPFLFPTTLKTNKVASFTSGLSLASQSPDKRWLLTNQSGQAGVFKLFDLKTTVKPISSDITLAADAYTPGDGAQTWAATEWSDDNRHVLLTHTYTTAGTTNKEYIMLDRQAVASSQNLTKALNLSAPEGLSLFDQKADKYYVYNTAEKTLRTASTSGTAPTALELKDVTAFKTYSNDTILYATGTPPSGKVTKGMVSVVLQQGNRSQVVRELPSNAPQYLLNLTQYSGDWYVTVGASNGKGVWVYKNPFDQKLDSSVSLPVPARFMKVANPGYSSFSASAQFILAENGEDCTVYDIENDNSYSYRTATIDAPQTNLRWMDGDRLYYVSGGKVVVADYDAQNVQSLQQASPSYDLFFSSDYKYVFTVAPAENGMSLTSTGLKVQ